MSGSNHRSEVVAGEEPRGEKPLLEVAGRCDEGQILEALCFANQPIRYPGVYLGLWLVIDAYLIVCYRLWILLVFPASIALNMVLCRVRAARQARQPIWRQFGSGFRFFSWGLEARRQSEAGQGSERLEYAQVKKIYETRRFFYLKMADRGFFFFPKSWLLPEQQAWLADYWKSLFGRRYEPTYFKKSNSACAQAGRHRRKQTVRGLPAAIVSVLLIVLLGLVALMAFAFIVFTLPEALDGIEDLLSILGAAAVLALSLFLLTRLFKWRDRSRRIDWDKADDDKTPWER